MALIREHELHQRRWGRNLGLGLTLGALILLIFGLTIAKVQTGDRMQAYDHSYRPEIDAQTVAPGAPQPAAAPEVTQ